MKQQLRLVLTALVLSSPSFAAPIPLSAFLDQVRQNHQGYRAASEASAGGKLRSTEASLLYHPQFSAEGQIYSDAKPTLNGFAPQKTDATGFKLGLAQQLPLGAQARLGYQLAHVQLDVLPSSAAFFNFRDYYDAIPSIDVNVPLWRGVGGSESQASKTIIEAAGLASHYAEGFKARMTLFEAELGYWRLAIAREVVKVQRQVLDRSKFLENWASKRVQLHLGDASDLLQAKAATSYRALELKNAIDEERAATQNFNSLRGTEPASSVHELEPLSKASLDIPSSLKDLTTPPSARGDLKAAEQAERIATAQATQAVERNRPQIDLFGSLSLNGRGGSQAEAISRGWDFDHKTSVVGVKLVSTLDFWNRWDARTGASLEREAAGLVYDRKRFEQQQEFNDLKLKLSEAQARLKLAESLASIQADKLERERDKLQRGRSTTFQLIQFENDSATAQLGRLRSQFDVIRLAAQLNTFASEE